MIGAAFGAAVVCLSTCFVFGDCWLAHPPPAAWRGRLLTLLDGSTVQTCRTKLCASFSKHPEPVRALAPSPHISRNMLPCFDDCSGAEVWLMPSLERRPWLFGVSHRCLAVPEAARDLRQVLRICVSLGLRHRTVSVRRTK